MNGEADTSLKRWSSTFQCKAGTHSLKSTQRGKSDLVGVNRFLCAHAQPKMGPHFCDTHT